MTEPRENPSSNGGAPAPTATSRSLLERVQADDAAAWDRLVGLYAPLVLHWCRRWGLKDEDAADVFQEVFQAVATHIAGFHKEGPADTFRGWLRTITHNKVRDHFRRRIREPEGVGGTDAQVWLAQVPAPEVREEDADDDAQAERDLFRRVLQLIRGDFEERTWQAFWRTAVEGRATQDVAAELAMSPGAVRVAKSRVLQRLREEMGDVFEERSG